MVSTMASRLAHNPNLVLGVNVQWPVVVTASRQYKQEPIVPRLPNSETEQLLDIDGLLEIARLIRSIKEDGRLKYRDEEHPEQINIPPTKRRKHQ
jgi:predicted acylesterase/phospholipase RssA